MQFQELGWTHAEGVAYITLHRPERRNAMTTVMLAELLYALEHCASESAVRVVVLQGAGTGFCAGDDLAGMGSLPDGFAYQPQHSLTHAGLQSCLMGLPKPVVAVLHDNNVAVLSSIGRFDNCAVINTVNHIPFGPDKVYSEVAVCQIE